MFKEFGFALAWASENMDVGLTSWNGSAYADKAMQLIEEIHNEPKTP
jgi:hypothetical protein